MKAKQVVRGPFFWIGLVVLGFIVFSQFTSTAGTFKKVDTATVIAAITEGKVDSALLVDREQLIQVTLKNGITIDGAKRIQASYIVRQETQLTDLLIAHQPPSLWDVKVPTQSGFVSLLLAIAPILVISVIFLFFMNQMQGGGGRVMQFGRSRAKLQSKETPKTTFADVAGVDEAYLLGLRVAS